MFKRALITSALLSTMAVLSSGCGDSVLGPQGRSQAQTESQPVPTQPIEPIATPCFQVGDLTGDGRVDASDVSFYASFDLYMDGVVNTRDEEMFAAVVQNTPIDTNGNGFVDASDYSAFAFAKGLADHNKNGLVDAGDVSYHAWGKAKLDLNRDGLLNAEDRAELDRRLGEVSVCS
jgi:hypothetical protein